MENVPIYEKCLISIDEAAMYGGIGRSKLRAMISDDSSCCTFIVRYGENGIKIKREKFREYLNKVSVL